MLVGLEGAAVEAGTRHIETLIPAFLAPKVKVLGLVLDGIVSAIAQNLELVLCSEVDLLNPGLTTVFGPVEKSV